MQTQTIGKSKFTAEDIFSIKIQSLWKGYRVRKNFLSKVSYKLAVQFIEQYPTMTDVPKASTGITKVFLPTHLPIVLKALGTIRSKNRFFTMWKARELCLKNGYKHLLIPQAHPYKDYNIEERFPVIDVKQREQIALYEENQECFLEVVKEFTGFLCKCIFPDILTYSHPYLQSDKIPLVRCDNLPLLIDQNIGKIALIDLGGLQIRSNKLSLDEATDCTKTALFIFPYHLTEILKVVESFCPEIHSRLSDLKELCKQTILQLKSIYADHQKFIAKKSESAAQHFYFQKSEVGMTTQLWIEKLIENYTDQLDQQFTNQKNILLFLKTILEPIAVKLIQNYENPSVDFNIRAMTINCETLFDAFSEEEDLINAKIFMQMILDHLINEGQICYANLYFTRLKKQHLRIHY